MRFKAITGLLLLATMHAALAGPEEIEKLEDSLDVLYAINQISESSIPPSLLDHAEGIAIVPGVIKAGLVVGGRHGTGVLSVRGDDGSWSNPTFIKLTGGSIGFQAGVQSSDVILVFKTRRSVDGIVNGTFKLGADASVAAGPVGREASASTDLELKAEIYSYSRARGLFAGVSLDGSALRIDHDRNVALYGPSATPRRIFASRVETIPLAVVDYRDGLEEALAY